MENAGSLAEAALKLNGVFQAAENACNQYMLNIHAMEERQKQLCAQAEREMKAKCVRMIAEAKCQADACAREAHRTAETV